MSYKGTKQKIYTVEEVQLIIDKLLPIKKVSHADFESVAKIVDRTSTAIRLIYEYYRVWKKNGTVYRTREYMAKKIFPKIGQTQGFPSQVKIFSSQTLPPVSFASLDQVFEDFKVKLVDVLIGLNKELMKTEFDKGYQKGKEDGEVEYRQKKISTLLQNRLNEGGNNHGS